MQIKEFSQTENKDYWIEKIAQADWSAGKYLGQILRDGSFYELCGSKSKVFLLTEENELLSFCSYAEIDDVPDTSLKPWIGFVYTFPAFRGKRLIAKLLDHACSCAKEEGYKAVYVSTDQKGLYENFGFEFLQEAQDRRGDVSLVYKRLVLV